MPARWITINPADVMADGLRAIRAEVGVSIDFPAAVEAEAHAAPEGVEKQGERVDLPFVTIDPPGSLDLDQAMHIERLGEGHRVRYAIADVAAFVGAGSALDVEAHVRGVTVYAPDAKAPVHPTVLSEGAASLLPDEWRPAVLWTLDLDGRGELVSTAVERAEVRSVTKATYADVPADIAPLLAEVGERRLELERERGGVRLAVPEQEVEREGEGWTVRYRAPVATEDHNAQISLLTGMAAAQLMLAAGTGILRVQPSPDARSLNRFRRQAAALGIDWPEGTSYPDFIRGLDVGEPDHAALMHEATSVGRGAGYVAFDGGAVPAEHAHFSIAADYAHATAPLRRLQDRYVSECCLAAYAESPVPDWVRAGLAELPDAMAAGARRANAVERGVVDLVEAMLLAGHEGESFEAVVVDEDLLQLREPAVRARLADGCPELGSEVTVKLLRADPGTRTVDFEPA